MKEGAYVHCIYNYTILLHIYLYTCTSTFCMAYPHSVLGKSLLQFQRGTEINEPGFCKQQ